MEESGREPADSLLNDGPPDLIRLTRWGRDVGAESDGVQSSRVDADGYQGFAHDQGPVFGENTGVPWTPGRAGETDENGGGDLASFQFVDEFLGALECGIFEDGTSGWKPQMARDFGIRRDLCALDNLNGRAVRQWHWLVEKLSARGLDQVGDHDALLDFGRNLGECVDVWVEAAAGFATSQPK